VPVHVEQERGSGPAALGLNPFERGASGHVQAGPIRAEDPGAMLAKAKPIVWTPECRAAISLALDMIFRRIH
jgi:hypothetical protein